LNLKKKTISRKQDRNKIKKRRGLWGLVGRSVSMKEKMVRKEEMKKKKRPTCEYSSYIHKGLIN